MTQPTARDEIRSYVRLLADWWTPRSQTDQRVEAVYQAVRAEVLTEAAELIRRQKIHGVQDPADAYERWGGMQDAAALLLATRTETPQES